MSEARIWLVYSREHEAWWRPASAGYTTSIAEAGRYTKAEAARHCTSVDRMSDGQTKEFAHLAPEVEENVLALADLLAVIPRLLRVIEALMPGLKHIAIEDYQELNEAPIAARAALSAVHPEEGKT